MLEQNLDQHRNTLRLGSEQECARVHTGRMLTVIPLCVSSAELLYVL